MAWPVILAFIFCGTCCFAQADLANKYRAGMIPTFVKYAKIGSMSDDNAEWMTPGQEKMAQVLYEDVKALGFPTHFSADKYIYVNIPSNLGYDAPVLGISAHYDTTPDINGNGIRPRVIQNYKGKIIDLTPQETDPTKKKVIDPAQDTYLQRMIGKTIVVEEGGNTNLGADDKAGVTIVMTLLKTLAQNPNFKHGPIQVVLTPNEDVGRSAERLELEYYHPDYAFDFDAGVDGEVIVENFTAEKILVTVHGINGHQSFAAQNGYRNSSAPAAYIITQMARVEDLPNHSEGEAGYIEPHHTTYNPENNTTTVDFRLRYFDKKDGTRWHTRLATAVLEATMRYDVKIDVDNVVQYDNVANGVKANAKELTAAAMSEAGITPNFKKERAGTTSAMIMAKHGFGGYTVFTGQNNPHAFTEWLSEEDMFNGYKVALYLIKEVSALQK